MARWLALLTALAWLAAAPAHAIDCGKATQDYEKAICADPKLVAADGELSRFYFDRLRSLTGEAHDLLQADQRHWVESRGGHCRPLTSDCLPKDIAARRRAIAACTRPVGSPVDDPDNQIECLYYHHGGCPALDARGSANLAGFPFLLQKLVAQSENDLGGFDCDPTSPQAREKDNVGETTYRIVDGPLGVISVAIDTAGCARGAAHCYSSEHLRTWDLRTQSEITFSALFNGITSHSAVYDLLRKVIDGRLDRPCCGDDRAAADLSIGDLRLDEGETLPSGWTVKPNGDLVVAYAYSSLGHSFLSHATIPRASFITMVAPKYTALFDPRPR